jgi:hypothetical protein
MGYRSMTTGDCLIVRWWGQGEPMEPESLRLNKASKSDTEFHQVHTVFHRESKWRFAHRRASADVRNAGAKRQ